MSQSATLYRVTSDKFKEIEKVNGKKVNPEKLSEEYSTYAGSFMALEFILSKGKDENACKLVVEIFNPGNSLGAEGMSSVNFDNVDEQALWNMIDSVSYITPERVKEINELLNSENQAKVASNYNSKELNDNGIYPWCWHDDNGDNEVFNQRHLLEDFAELKVFFSRAAADNNYVLSYVG
ncbi:YfbM family protein [Chitinophagaceae bacterium LB-8]|uniref:YfbM family protein n=1 Tax=Paraflavisolibacter caeni TaxID=2982496 RepID=A0A9X2XV34_9BACT|nr:DUF1877 family protein [Paraflavisolibacter caeni]MCU7548298.1 YfbM family protein [Paraflavisolibacter caeni]